MNRIKKEKKLTPIGSLISSSSAVIAMYLVQQLSTIF